MVENRKINPWTWQDQFGFSQAIETTGHTRVLRCAGQTSVNAEGEPVHDGDMAAQITQALDNLETVLQAADMALANVVRLNLYVTDIDAALENFGPMEERLAVAGIQPAITLLGVSRLFIPSLLVEMEADAVA
ncbi:MAG TPA: RidA family protein [Gammaproteobacteria bacterium]|jgi:enamine deaminase RidA (YjgF/YER057c/UK114 family)|nr:RidA family protein [Gammaproteobacteria bacterium]